MKTLLSQILPVGTGWVQSWSKKVGLFCHKVLLGPVGPYHFNFCTGTHKHVSTCTPISSAIRTHLMQSSTTPALDHGTRSMFMRVWRRYPLGPPTGPNPTNPQPTNLNTGCKFTANWPGDEPEAGEGFQNLSKSTNHPDIICRRNRKT